jgi:formylglycine-generating enzyme
MNCISWYEAFAFCIWDGGRLPTEAEWNYAAAGGTEQRVYPWSSPPASTTLDYSHAVYDDGGAIAPQNVGSKSPKGDSKFGQADLAGNVWEWALDSYANSLPASCANCANLGSAAHRVVRGGSFNYNASYLLVSPRCDDPPAGRYAGLGARCARSAP